MHLSQLRGVGRTVELIHQYGLENVMCVAISPSGGDLLRQGFGQGRLNDELALPRDTTRDAAPTTS
jgi:hypothetical protein